MKQNCPHFTKPGLTKTANCSLGQALIKIGYSSLAWILTQIKPSSVDQDINVGHALLGPGIYLILLFRTNA
jgi:hypothetical protein